MNGFDLLIDAGVNRKLEGRYQGVFVGVVTNNEDPDGRGRVKVKFPWLSDEDESNWARIVTPMAGEERGLFFLPEVDDEVLVAFEHGDVRFPYVIGSLWNGQQPPPETNADGANNIRMIKSRSGHMIRFSDEDGSEKIEIVDKSENNKIVFDTAANTIAITADADVTFAASQGSIKLEAQKIEIISSAETKIEAGSEMKVEASATMNIKGATVNIN